MKMVLLPSSILVLLYAFPSTRLVSAQSSASGTYTFSNDVTAFIPSCAQTCFSSFVQANFPISVCSSTPSLECLCSHNSTSGYTVGEGALQCIISEDNVGFCQGANATTTVVMDAYNMCFGKANALPNTHATITATLVVQTSAPSIVLVATTSTWSSLPSSITSVVTVPTTAGLVTANGSPGSISLSITSNPTTQGQSAQTSAAAAANLTAPQIAGIAVGSGAVAILAIGGLILFGCLRRRKILRDDGESDFGTFQEEHGNSMEAMFTGPVDKKQGSFAPGGTRNGVAAKVAPPIPPPPVVTDPNMFSRRSIPTEEIGIAISPDMAQTADGGFEDGFGGRHPSRLLPEKPALPKLNVVVPHQSISEPWRPQYHPPQAKDPRLDIGTEEKRDSAATQFDVDITSPVEFSKGATNYDYGYAYPYQHGGPKLPGNWQQEQPPRSMTAPIHTFPKPLDIRKTQSHQSFSQPLQPRTAASSVYTGRGSLAPSDGGDITRNGQQPQSYKPLNPYERNARNSSESLTSMESAAQVEIRLPQIRTADLSPVAESPSRKSPVGRSPVQYPEIKSRLSDQMMRGMPPPKQPVFELWRQPEIEQERKRTMKVTRDSIPPPIVYNITGNVSVTDIANANHDAPYPNDARSAIATRRNKLAPALNLDGEKKKKKKGQEWRVMPENESDDMKSPVWQTTLTPQRIGDDLFLGVQKY
jgi:hypothetical protein